MSLLFLIINFVIKLSNAWKANFNLLSTVMNCQIVCSRSLTHRINHKFMSVCLLAMNISQWTRGNSCIAKKCSFCVLGSLERNQALRKIKFLDISAICKSFTYSMSSNKTVLAGRTHFREDQGPVSRKPGKLFGPVKPFLRFICI